MLSEGLSEHEPGIIRVYSGRTWEQGNMWVPSHHGSCSGEVQVMSHILVNQEWADIIQPQDTLDAEGTLPPHCHDLEAKDNPYIPQLELYII